MTELPSNALLHFETAYSSFYSFRPTQISNGPTSDEYDELLGLSKDPMLSIQRPDKRNGGT